MAPAQAVPPAGPDSAAAEERVLRRPELQAAHRGRGAGARHRAELPEGAGILLQAADGSGWARGRGESQPKGVSKQLDYEVELAIVIGRTCRDVKKSEARSVVFGYTVLNDITARDLQRAHGQWFKGKSLDTTCPIGPWIVTADEFGAPAATASRYASTARRARIPTLPTCSSTVDAIIESLSAGLTLEPGDIICTGTPSGVGMGLEPQVWLQGRRRGRGRDRGHRHPPQHRAPAAIIKPLFNDFGVALSQG